MALATLVVVELVACSTLLLFGWILDWSRQTRSVGRAAVPRGLGSAGSTAGVRSRSPIRS